MAQNLVNEILAEQFIIEEEARKRDHLNIDKSSQIEFKRVTIEFGRAFHLFSARVNGVPTNFDARVLESGRVSVGREASWVSDSETARLVP